LRVGIPTYNRQSIIKDKTLGWLEREGIPHNDIYLFVHSEEIKKEYCKELGDKYNIVVGAKECVPQLKYMADYFEEGENVLFMDDDIKGMVIKEGYEKYYKSLKVFAQKAFENIRNKNCYLWGVYPSSNKFFMRGKITYSFKLIIGGLYGMVIRKEKWFTVPMKTDYELTIKHWIKDGITARYNFLGVDTQVYAGKGGLQDDKDREKKDWQACMIMLEKYPQLVALKKAKTGYPEIRFKKAMA